jgi:putative mRNA 3-end processing factor
LVAQISFSQCGILIDSSGKKISLDPHRETHSDMIFVSHAHTDHLYKKCGGKNNTLKSKTLASRETSIIAEARGYTLSGSQEEHDGFKLIDTGHILGSKGLLVNCDEIYYTGDISIKERAFMRPALIPQAETLIIESTFGRPEYVFPDLQEVIHNANKIISEMYDKGIPVLLMGYPLGKAQLLTELFGHWDPLYLYDAVYNMNSIYSKLGVRLKHTVKHSTAEDQNLLSKNKPWIMISPLFHGRNGFVRRMKERYGAVTIGFSGWAVNTNYKFMMGLDYTLPMSDHCDYKDLVQVVRKCNPKKVYTFHGFTIDFARRLRKLGFDADPLLDKDERRQGRVKSASSVISSLDNYMMNE